MQKVVLGLFFLALTGQVHADSRQPCKPFGDQLTAIRDECRNKVKTVAKSEYDIGVFGLKRLRDSKDQKDQALRKALSAVAKSCLMENAKMNLPEGPQKPACLDKLKDHKTDFDD